MRCANAWITWRNHQPSTINHQPSTINHSSDAVRKCLDYVVPLCQSHGRIGWCKEEDWRARLKSDRRAVSRTNQSGGAHKEDRLLKQVHAYLADARQFEAKVFDSGRHLRDQPLSLWETVQLALLSYFHDELIRHLDWVERRLIQGETIPHAEKRFSLFEPHTEWVNCLEHHGLNRCLDKGREGYGRYVGLGVLSYNLHKIGAHRLKRHAAQSKELQAA